MKISTLSLFFSLCLATSSFSQEWRLAPTIGLNAAGLTYSNAFRNDLNSSVANARTGFLFRFQAGALLDYEISDRFSVRSGLIFTGKGGSIHASDSQYGIVQSARIRYLFNYLEIPLLFNVAIGNNDYRIVGGPVFGLTLNGKGVVNGSYNYVDVTNLIVGTDYTATLLPTDISISLGLVKELRIGDNPLEIGLHVQPSVSSWNTSSRTMPSYSGRNLLIGLRTAYFFDLSR